ncbi:MAG: nuclear transport factor 2 family protein [Pyrinomonadaceae bacterium]
MKKISLLALVATLALLLGGWVRATVAQNAEEAAIRQAVEHYIRGHATGDGAHFRKVFHPDSKLFSIRDGKIAQLTSEEYIARAPGKPPADEAQRKRSIDSIDISGNAAMVKITLDYPQVRFTDYMSMLKIDGEWRIVNKTFYAESKNKG